MSEDYRRLIEKADLALSDLTSDGGILQPGQAAEFIQLAIEESRLMSLARTQTLKTPNDLIEKIVFGSRIMRAGQSHTALTEAQRSKPTTSKTQFAAKEIVAEVRLGYDAVEDNIEQGRLPKTVMSLIVKRAAVDMEELFLQGSLSSSDEYLALLDGLIAQATTHTYDANDAELDREILRATFQEIPKQFRTDKAGLRFLTATDAELHYNETLADRQGAMGDTYQTAEKKSVWKGINVEGMHLMPDGLGTGSDQTIVLATHMDNIAVGIWRQLRLETDKDISARELIFVLTARVDAKFVHEPAVAKATEVKVV